VARHEEYNSKGVIPVIANSNGEIIFPPENCATAASCFSELIILAVEGVYDVFIVKEFHWW
jgi:hypothetical protein